VEGNAEAGLNRRAVAAVIRHPSLWVTAIRQASRLATPGWWRRRPYLPLPDREYMRFRLETQYGDTAHAAEGDDLVAYLRWCRALNR
jgi:hypothetical protein